MTRCTTLVLLAFGACAPPPAAPATAPSPASVETPRSPGADEPVWLAQDLAWGRQCEPRAGEVRDRLVGALQDAGLAVEAVARRGRAAIRACGAAAFPETVWLLVPQQDVELARSMGYLLEQAPRPSDILWP